MKRILSVALALTLLSGSAAVAGPYGHGNYGQHNGYSQHYRGDYYRGHRGNDAGPAIAVGVGILALTAILASQSRERERVRERGYDQGPNGYEPNGYGQNGYAPNGYSPNDGPNGNYDQNRR